MDGAGIVPVGGGRANGLSDNYLSVLTPRHIDEEAGRWLPSGNWIGNGAAAWQLVLVGVPG